jgi:hypothetical protein
MQTDGNLVLYHKSDGRALWAAENTYGSGATDVVMQGGKKIQLKLKLKLRFEVNLVQKSLTPRVKEPEKRFHTLIASLCHN